MSVATRPQSRFRLTLLTLVLFTLAIMVTVAYAAPVRIDLFSSQSHSASHSIEDADEDDIPDEPLPVVVCDRRAPNLTSTLGQSRNLCLEVVNGDIDASAQIQVSAAVANRYMVLELSPSVTARAFAQWDGTTDNTLAIDPIGLGGVDLTDGGTNDGILVRIINSDGVPVNVIVRLYTNGTNWAEQSRLVSTVINAGQVVDIFYPFSAFGGGAGTLNPASIGAVEIEMDATISAGADLTVKLVEATTLWDLGDLPAPYPTTLADDGARHRTTTGLRLGASVDSETNGVPSGTATGDDTAFAFGTADDEDGVVRGSVLNGSNGGWANGLVSAGNGGRLSLTINGGSGVPQVFIDFGDGAGNLSGTLTEVTLLTSTGANLLATPTTPLAAGTHQAYFDIPSGSFAVNNQPMAVRVRLSSAGLLSATGAAPDGEVEDYIYSFGPLAVTLSNTNTSTPAGNIALPALAVLLFSLTGLALAYGRRAEQL